MSLKFHLYRNVTGAYFINTSKHAKRGLGANHYYSIILGHKCILKKIATVMEETTVVKIFHKISANTVQSFNDIQCYTMLVKILILTY